MATSQPLFVHRKLEWERKMRPLIGREIVDARYMDAGERAACGFFHSCLVLQLDDGTLLYPMADDEGNDAGAMAIQPGSIPGMPKGAPVLS